jgi:PAS domain S-box-containing protein
MPNQVSKPRSGRAARPREIALRLAAIVEWSDDAIVSKTLDGTITSWNRAAERIFGWSAEEAIGQSIRLIIPPELWPEENEVLRQVGGGEVVHHFETVRQRRDGSRLDVSLTVSPIKDAAGRIIGASKIARDISERKRAEAAMAAAESRLQALLEEAQAANRAKDEFLAVLSHELRTPLNAILGWSELLRLRHTDREFTERGLATISRSVRAQAQLIEDLLDISRITSGKMRLDVRTIEVVPVVEAAIETIRPAAEAKQIRLQTVLDPAGAVLGDADRLQQVMWNLLSNAVKFTPKKGRIQVIVSRINSHAEIVVSDSGIGIAPELLPHVFERFRQADSTSRRQFGGMGLGLAIARELVQLHGGVLEARSEGAGRGSTFAVHLPLSLVPAAPAGELREHPTVPPLSPPAVAPPQLSGLRVLVVDDDAPTCELAEMILGSLGAKVLLATSAAEGFETLRRHRPDALVADIEMPGEDGYSLIRRVRSLAWNEGGGTPAAALTAFSRNEDRWRALGAGFQLHLAKPIEPLGLAVAVANLAGRREPTPAGGPEPATEPGNPVPE